MADYPSSVDTLALSPSPSRDETLQRVRERIVRFAASRLSKDVAEDLAQDVLVLLTTKYADKSNIEDLLPLAFRVVRFKMLAYRRKLQRRGEDRQESLDDVEYALGDPSVIPHPDVQLRRRELRERLVSAVRQLTGRCRDLFRMKLQGLSFVEMQPLLGARSINTVYTWDARCRQRLLQLMGGSWER